MKLVVTLIILLSAINSYSQCDECNRGITLFGGGGTGFTNSLNDDYHRRPNLDLSIGYVINKNMMARIDYQYVYFALKSDTPNVVFEEVGDIGKLSTDILKLSFLYGDFRMRKSLQVYAGGGMGIYYIAVQKKVNSVQASSQESKFGVSGTMGLSIRIHKDLRIYLEGQYHGIFNDGTLKSLIPVIVGIKYDFVG